MKVVCQKIPPVYITIKLTIGAIYDIYYKDGYVFVYDELGNTVPCDAFRNEKYFTTLENWRIKRLKLLGL